MEENNKYDYAIFAEETPRIFADRLKSVRIDAGFTQKKMAEELGISVAALSYYETAKRVPDIVFLVKVSEYFNIPVSYFLGYSISRSAENTVVSDNLHLSDAAIDNIRRFIEKDFEDMDDVEKVTGSNVLNLLLQENEFYSILNLITWSGVEKEIFMPDKKYVHFMATNKLMDLVEKVSLSIPRYEKNVIDELVDDPKIKNDFMLWILQATDEMIKNRIKEERESYNADLVAHEERMKEYYGEYEKTDRYKALKKLKEAANNGKHNPTP